jgi:hypothetical protein
MTTASTNVRITKTTGYLNSKIETRQKTVLADQKMDSEENGYSAVQAILSEKIKSSRANRQYRKPSKV